MDPTEESLINQIQEYIDRNWVIRQIFQQPHDQITGLLRDELEEAREEVNHTWNSLLAAREAADIDYAWAGNLEIADAHWRDAKRHLHAVLDIIRIRRRLRNHFWAEHVERNRTRNRLYYDLNRKIRTYL